MGVNILLFLIFQIGVEPWKRKRLVKGFEEKVMEALEREGPGAKQNPKRQPTGENIAIEEAIIADIAADGEQNRLTNMSILDSSSEAVTKEQPGKAIVVGVPIENAANSSTSTPGIFEFIKERIQDLFSDRRISLRRVDLTTVALQGTAAGLAFAGLFVLLLRPR